MLEHLEGSLSVDATKIGNVFSFLTSSAVELGTSELNCAMLRTMTAAQLVDTYKEIDRAGPLSVMLVSGMVQQLRDRLEMERTSNVDPKKYVVDSKDGYSYLDDLIDRANTLLLERAHESALRRVKKLDDYTFNGGGWYTPHKDGKRRKKADPLASPPPASNHLNISDKRLVKSASKTLSQSSPQFACPNGSQRTEETEEPKANVKPNELIAKPSATQASQASQEKSNSGGNDKKTGDGGGGDGNGTK